MRIQTQREAFALTAGLGESQGWQFHPEGPRWTHPNGFEVRPDDQPGEGRWQLWAPAGNFLGEGMAKVNRPTIDPQKHFDFVDRVSR